MLTKLKDSGCLALLTLGQKALWNKSIAKQYAFELLKNAFRTKNYFEKAHWRKFLGFTQDAF